MNVYIGVKLIKAKPMLFGEWARLSGKMELVDGALFTKHAEGYLVEYLDSPTPNVPGYDHYVSWSPKRIFELSYFQSGELSFGLALEAMRLGYVVTSDIIDKNLYQGVILTQEGVLSIIDNKNGIIRQWDFPKHVYLTKNWEITNTLFGALEKNAIVLSKTHKINA